MSLVPESNAYSFGATKRSPKTQVDTRADYNAVVPQKVPGGAMGKSKKLNSPLSYDSPGMGKYDIKPAVFDGPHYSIKGAKDKPREGFGVGPGSYDINSRNEGP
jgi:hypothetical protein